MSKGPFSPALILCLFAFACLAFSPLQAAQIGNIQELDFISQAQRFFSLSDYSVKIALTGATLLGICCGLLGPYLVVSRNSLLGDALSHALFPGIVLGYLWTMTKDSIGLFYGALIVGLLGTWCINAFKSTKPLKPDSSLGLVLSGFYSVGIVLLTMVQNLEVSNKSGLDKYLFGQITALSEVDIIRVAVVTFCVIFVIIFLYKELLMVSFDTTMSKLSLRWEKAIHVLLSALTAVVIVVSLKAMGVVLVTAMLIIPASTAYIVCKRFHSVLILSSSLGVFAAISGTFISFLNNQMPTGPVMVLCASALFGLTYTINTFKQ